MRWEGVGYLVVGLRIEVSVDMVIARGQTRTRYPGPLGLAYPNHAGNGQGDQDPERNGPAPGRGL
jgi:hypothetical protein